MCLLSLLSVAEFIIMLTAFTVSTGVLYPNSVNSVVALKEKALISS